jgi:hypothetical protein
MDDIIQHCLSLAPVPGLGSAFALLRFIWTSVDGVQSCKEQLVALTQSTAHLLATLQTEYQGGRLLEAHTSVPLSKLSKQVITTCPGFIFMCILGYWKMFHDLLGPKLNKVFSPRFFRRIGELLVLKSIIGKSQMQSTPSRCGH